MKSLTKTAMLKSINPQKEILTPEKLRTFAGMETLSDQDAVETVFAIQAFSNILYEFISEQKHTSLTGFKK